MVLLAYLLWRFQREWDDRRKAAAAGVEEEIRLGLLHMQDLFGAVPELKVMRKERNSLPRYSSKNNGNEWKL